MTGITNSTEQLPFREANIYAAGPAMLAFYETRDLITVYAGSRQQTLP
jgi:hypothetical protein